MIRKTGRAIIFNKNMDSLICIKRTKYDEKGNIIKEYYTLPGGHLEKNENFEEATVREVYEELGINVEIINEFFSFYNKDLDQEEKFFVCKHISGLVGSGTGEEWQTIDYVKYGRYEIVNIRIDELFKYNLLPIEVKEKILKIYNTSKKNK